MVGPPFFTLWLLFLLGHHGYIRASFQGEEGSKGLGMNQGGRVVSTGDPNLIKLCSPGRWTHGPHGQTPSCLHHVLSIPKQGALLRGPMEVLSPPAPPSLSQQRAVLLYAKCPCGAGPALTLSPTYHSPVHPSLGLGASQKQPKGSEHFVPATTVRWPDLPSPA